MTAPPAADSAGPRSHPAAPERPRGAAAVGREDDLAALARHCAALPSVVLVTGEPGVGKTCLVESFLAAGWPHRAFLARCAPFTEPLPLMPFAAGVARFVADRPRDAWSDDVRALGLLRGNEPDAPGEPLPREQRVAAQIRSFRALREVLTAFGPVLLVVEDVHWADDATRDFLLYLTSEPPPDVAVVVTARPGDEGLAAALGHASAPVLRIDLEPLDAEGVAAMVCQILGVREVSSDFVNALREWTGGLPLAIENVVSLLVERQDIVTRAGRAVRRAIGELRVPRAFRDSVVARFRELPEAARAVVAASAVLATPEPPHVVAATAGLSRSDARSGIDEAAGAGFLEVDDERGVTFRHALTRDAVYDAIPVLRRRDLHAAAATALGATRPAAALARHAKHAGHTREWVQWAREAARQARLAGDDAAAALPLLDAATAPDLDPRDRTRLVIEGGEAALAGGEQDRAVALFERAVGDSATSPELDGELRACFGRVLIQAGQYDRGIDQLRHAVRLLPPGSPSAVRTHGVLGLPIGVALTVGEHRAHQAAAEAAAPPEDAALRVALAANRATFDLAYGAPTRWHPPALDEASAPALAQEVTRALANLASVAAQAGDTMTARAFLDRYAALPPALRGGRFAGSAAGSALLLAFDAGEWDGIEERARATLAQHSDTLIGVVDAHLVLGAYVAAVEGPVAALPLLSEIHAECRAAMGVPLVLLAAAAYARALRLARRDDASAEVIAGALAICAAKDVLSAAGPLLTEAVWPAAAQGRLDAFAADAVAATRDAATPATRAAVRELEAHVALAGGAPDGAERRALAIAAWETVGHRYAAAKCREALAYGSADELRAAREAYAALGARADVSRMSAALHHVIPQGQRGRGRRSYGDALSPREEEVVSLVREGLTNEEIGRRLFLSPVTVGHHVARARRKLAVATRRELRDTTHVTGGLR